MIGSLLISPGGWVYYRSDDTVGALSVGWGGVKGDRDME